MKHFCTLFDKNYLTRGLAMHESMIRHCGEFILWILPMDEESKNILTKLDLERVRILNLNKIEDSRLLSIKPLRKPVEYYWTFSSSLPLYLLQNNPDMEMIAYLDADTYFFSSTEEIYKEFSDKSIMLVPHRFGKDKLHLERVSGTYNVNMMIFRNNPESIESLVWWKDRCIEWCHDYYEDGKLGDQLYLNDWTTRFSNVHVLQNIGANVAPWNISNYVITEENGKKFVLDKSTGRKSALIFYHFHGLKIYLSRGNLVKMWPITTYNKNIYQDYQAALQNAYLKAIKIEPSWKWGATKKLDFLRKIKQYLGLYKRLILSG